MRYVIFTYHSPSHLLKGSILSFYNSILLWSSRTWHFMLNSLFITISHDELVNELTTFITSYFQNRKTFFFLNSYWKNLKMRKSLIFVFQKENPSETRKTSTKTKTYLLPFKLLVLVGPKRSTWINSNGLVDMMSLIGLKEDMVCFLS